MPKYRVINKKTKEEQIIEMKISEVDNFLKDNIDLDIIPGIPLISYNDLRKPSEGFRDRLREIKKSHHGNKINIW